MPSEACSNSARTYSSLSRNAAAVRRASASRRLRCAAVSRMKPIASTSATNSTSADATSGAYQPKRAPSTIAIAIGGRTPRPTQHPARRDTARVVGAHHGQQPAIGAGREEPEVQQRARRSPCGRPCRCTAAGATRRTAASAPNRYPRSTRSAIAPDATARYSHAGASPRARAGARPSRTTRRRVAVCGEGRQRLRRANSWSIGRSMPLPYSNRVRPAIAQIAIAQSRASDARSLAQFVHEAAARFPARMHITAVFWTIAIGTRRQRRHPPERPATSRPAPRRRP